MPNPYVTPPIRETRRRLKLGLSGLPDLLVITAGGASVVTAGGSYVVTA